ncbi:hypothetical protein B7P43_G10555 [Cryptotermes secundus]|uniref:Uncharacterized protein n=1 Tax=Cryptotermes secundus TaxID=105785 RepID=A0A2J7PX83_9NEOP|nr:hypothetical protein B7P43_G10555 [Cryptotermes secundus]
MKCSELQCQCCVGLNLEVSKITMELESALKIIEILKEELGSAVALSSANKSVIQNNENGSQICPSEKNWIQIQRNQQMKITDKLKDHEETYVTTSNHFEILSNLSEVIKSTEATKEEILKPSKTVQNNINKSNFQARDSKYKADAKGQMINNISVIINGLVTSNNNKVLNSDILHSYDGEETVEANARNKKEAPKEKVAVQQQVLQRTKETTLY